MSTSQETRQEIYRIATEQLEALQRDMQDAERQAAQEAAKEAGRRAGRKMHVLLAGGVLLSSLMSALAANTLPPLMNRPLSLAEAQAIRNLCSYVAAKKSVSNGWVEEIVLTRFNIHSFDQLPANNYDEALTYLLKLAG